MALHGATFVAPVPGTPPVGMSATDGRLVMGGLFGVTPQLVAGGGIVQSGSTMQFTIAQSVFQLPDVTNAGATAFLPTDSTILTPAAGPGTGSRIDLFCVPFKNYENGDGISQSQPIVVAGTAGAPGVAPAVPAGSYRYASVLVPTAAATATACTVTIYGNTTFAPVKLNTPSFAVLGTVAGILNQKTYSALEAITYRWNGAAWKPWESDWISYTPTLTNVTVGTGTTFGQYRFTGGQLFIEGRFVYGSTSAVGSSPRVNHPSTYLVSTNQASDPYPLGRADVLKSGTALYMGAVTTNGTNSSALFQTLNATGSYAFDNNLAAAVPITFATADVIAWKYDFTPA